MKEIEPRGGLVLSPIPWIRQWQVFNVSLTIVFAFPHRELNLKVRSRWPDIKAISTDVSFILSSSKKFRGKECIPVGCVPNAAVAVYWGDICLSACWVWAWTPLPEARPLNFSLGCGPGDPPQGQTLQLPPWVWAWRPPQARSLNSPLGVGLKTAPQARPLYLHPECGPGDLQGMLGYYHPPPCGQNDRHV